MPAFFAPGERADYEHFLDTAPAHYRVYLAGGRIVAACGLRVGDDDRRGRIQWILVDAAQIGSGLGNRMMTDLLAEAVAEGLHVVDISASQKSAPFFERYGAVEQSRLSEGWGAGLDRVEMEMVIDLAGQ